MSVGFRLDTTGVATVGIDQSSLGLTCSHHYLVGVHDDYMVAGIHIRGIDRLVLTTQNASNFGTKPTEDEAFGVDNVPVTLDFTCFRSVRRHAAISIESMCVWCSKGTVK